MEQDEFDAELAELEVRLERLRSLYEQYFLGIERIEPSVARKDVDRRFWRIRKVRVRNTARRFKLQTLLQRYNTLQQHWGKICRQIENGTYIRQLARAKRRMGDDALLEPARRARESSAPPAAAAPQAQSPVPERAGDFERKIERLHDQLVAAQRELDPKGQVVSRKALAASLRVTDEKLRLKHSGSDVDFQVVVRDGRVAIRPVVKKPGA